jgi:hypothetical protein
MKILLAALLCAATLVQAQVPRTISLQGHLSQPSGSPVGGPVSMTFKLYTVASNGSALWEETHPAVAIGNGVFSVILGSLLPFTVGFEQPYFVGVSVAGGAELAPRIALGSAPYAVRSLTAETLANPITAGVIVDGSISLDRLNNACAVGQILVRTATGWQCLPGP